MTDEWKQYINDINIRYNKLPDDIKKFIYSESEVQERLIRLWQESRVYDINGYDEQYQMAISTLKEDFINNPPMWYLQSLLDREAEIQNTDIWKIYVITWNNETLSPIRTSLNALRDGELPYDASNLFAHYSPFNIFYIDNKYIVIQPDLAEAL